MLNSINFPFVEEIAKPAEPVNDQKERRILSPPPVCYSKGEISMAEDVACKAHIQYTLNAVCKIVIVKAGTFASR